MRRRIAVQLYRHMAGAIRAWRQQHGLSQDDLGRLLGMTRAGVASLERGRQRVLIEHLYTIEGAYGTRVVEFLP